MPLSLALFLLLTLPSCAAVTPTPAEQHHANMQATRNWIRGLLSETCLSLPGQESQRACAMACASVLAKMRGAPFTHQDRFRIELAKVRARDELRRLWTRAEQETWLRGPKTRACKQAPLATYAENCLNSVHDDLDALSFPDNMENAHPVVRAERAVGRIEADELERAVDRLRGQESDLVLQKQEEIEPTLMVLGIGGELFGTSTATAPPEVLPQPVTEMPLTSLLPSPPVSCTSRHVGALVYTNCY